MLIESVTFKNFRALRDTTLPLGQFTLLVGPNASGKSTALRGIKALAEFDRPNWSQLSVNPDVADSRTLMFVMGSFLFKQKNISVHLRQERIGTQRLPNTEPITSQVNESVKDEFRFAIQKSAFFSFEPRIIEQPVKLVPSIELGPRGENLAVVLDRIRDEYPERFEQINHEVGRLLPEFNRVLFTTPNEGMRAFQLRRRSDAIAIPANCLSDGTLIALALLTLVYMPKPPPIVCIEEPDRHIHPRLLSDIRDALYRLAYPKDFGEDREPVQVIATTHSPYMLDLFRDHPEEIVIASKTEDNVTFERLSDRKDVKEILRDTPLGEAWYSGILGGVPSGT